MNVQPIDLATRIPPAPVSLLDGPALAAQLPDVAYVVEGIGLVGGGGAPHLLAGYGFSGKTLAAQSMALALAAGRPVWGFYSCRDPRRVLHVDLEQGDRLTRRRYQRLALSMGVDLASLGDALSVAMMPSGLTLSPDCADRWRELMRGRDLVIVDSLRAATGGQDENSSDIRGGLDMLGNLSEQTGCRALVIHHARKPHEGDAGGRYAIRGSSAIYDGCDGAYIFAAEKGEPIQVQQVKARSHGEPVEDFALVISDVAEGSDPKAGLRVQVHGVELVWQRRSEAKQARRNSKAREEADAVRRAISERPGIGSRELRATTGLSGDQLAAALAELGDLVAVREEANGRARTTRHYLQSQAPPLPPDPPPQRTRGRVESLRLHSTRHAGAVTGGDARDETNSPPVSTRPRVDGGGPEPSAPAPVDPPAADDDGSIEWSLM